MSLTPTRLLLILFALSLARRAPLASVAAPATQTDTKAHQGL